MAVGKSEHCVGEPPAEALAVLELFEKLCVVFWPVELSGFHEARRSGGKYSQISGKRRAASGRFVRHKPMNGSQAVEPVNFNVKKFALERASQISARKISFGNMRNNTIDLNHKSRYDLGL